nr:hypothetical protein [Tanacetum cinerariifolium]
MEELMKDRYEMVGNQYMSKAEYEYNMDQMTITMSDDMDWTLDHRVGIESKDPLPLIGPKIERYAAEYKCGWIEEDIGKLWRKNLRVEDVQIGVESYQKSLNIIKPQMSIPKIKHYPTYTTCPKPFGVVYKGRDEKKKFMRGDEILEFCDGTLTDVREQLMNMLRLNQVGKKYKYLNEKMWTDRDV